MEKNDNPKADNKMMPKPQGVSFSTRVVLIGYLSLILSFLKITAVINWGWLWILSPIWIPFSIIFILILFIMAQGFLGKIIGRL